MKLTSGGAGRTRTHTAYLYALSVFKTVPLTIWVLLHVNASYNAAGRAIAGTENALTVHPHMLNISTKLLMFAENSYDNILQRRISSRG